MKKVKLLTFNVLLQRTKKMTLATNCQSKVEIAKTVGRDF